MARVLVVEDDKDLCGLIRHRLERAGHTVEEAASGEGAFRLLGERQYDLVTMDIHLPGISGWQLAREVKSELEIDHLPILVISVEGREDTPEDVKVEGWLAKPFGRADLARSVEEALARSDAESSMREKRS